MKKEDLITALIGLVAVDYFLARSSKEPKINFVEKLPGNYNAQTIPPFGIDIKISERENQRLIAHELEHWNQYKQTGAIIYGLKYCLQRVFYGYDNMPFEIEARKSAGENPDCIGNYTECVRTGKALTVYNPNFRI